MPVRQASCSSSSMALEIATNAVASRHRRPILRPKLPQDCQAMSPVAPAPSGRSTTGKPSRRPAPTATVGVMLEHRDIRQVDRIAVEPAREVPHVEPRPPEPQPRGLQPLDRQPAARATRPRIAGFAESTGTSSRAGSVRPGIREVSTVTSAPSAARAAAR